ncbi:MAG TPA: hypothetical protein PKD85_17585 [Saprospiraceae bacterium]|nr:hypothetical protein [Saprospiraceae bacterium]
MKNKISISLLVFMFCFCSIGLISQVTTEEDPTNPGYGCSELRFDCPGRFLSEVYGVNSGANNSIPCPCGATPSKCY